MRHILSTLLACAIALPAAAADYGYSLKGTAATGSNLKRLIMTNHPIPFDKGWKDLSTSQQQWVRSQYKQINDTDVPPFPLDGLARIYSTAHLVAEKIDAQGYLFMSVHVDETGKPDTVVVYNTPDPMVSFYVAHVLMLEKYSPATCNGTPCSMEFPFRMNIERSGLNHMQ